MLIIPNQINKYEIIDDHLYRIVNESEKELLCNFVPIVLSAKKSNSSNLLDDIEVDFQLRFGEAVISNRFIMSLTQIRILNWESLDYRCQLNNDLKASIINTQLYNTIRNQLAKNNIMKEVPKYEHTGWVKFNNDSAYLAGHKLINSLGIISEDAYQTPKELKEMNLEIDNTLSPSDTAMYMKNLLNLSPGVSDILIANLITGLLRSLFVEAGIAPSFTCYLVGPPQAKKTSIACHISSIYNRSIKSDFALINLISSSSAVHKSMNVLHDCCYIVDDLFKSETKSEMKKREARIGEVIRIIGNNSAKAMVEGKTIKNIPPNCTVVCTAEYLLQSESALARCVIMHMNDHPISNKLLFESQKSPKALSTFIYHFIKWSCGKNSDLILLIQEKLSEYKKQRSKRTSQIERSFEAGFILDTSINILMKYFTDNNFFDDAFIKNIQKNFIKNYAEIMSRQIEDMELNKSNDDENRFSKLIANIYTRDEIRLEKKKKKLSSDSQGIIHNNNLCLSSKYILSLSQKRFMDSSITIKKITNELKRNGLLDIDASNKSTKKIEGFRFLQIPIYKLKLYMDNDNSELSDPILKLKSNSLSWHNR